jgi:hypothetical protein
MEQQGQQHQQQQSQQEQKQEHQQQEQQQEKPLSTTNNIVIHRAIEAPIAQIRAAAVATRSVDHRGGEGGRRGHDSNNSCRCLRVHLQVGYHIVEEPIDQGSLQHMVDFLDSGEHSVVTELVLDNVKLTQPSGGGLDILRAFFSSRSDTTLTKVVLWHCDFGSHEGASKLLAAFQNNRTVVDLAICRIKNFEGAALGMSLYHILQDVPQLQRLNCTERFLGVDGVRAFQPGLQADRTLKQLILSACGLKDEEIRLIADALVGNTTMELLDVTHNRLTSNGLRA